MSSSTQADNKTKAKSVVNINLDETKNPSFADREQSKQVQDWTGNNPPAKPNVTPIQPGDKDAGKPAGQGKKSYTISVSGVVNVVESAEKDIEEIVKNVEQEILDKLPHFKVQRSVAVHD